MAKTPDDDVIVYEPRAKSSPFNWTVVAVLLVAWVLALVAAIVLRGRMFIIIMPILMIVLMTYLGFCTLVLLRRK